MIELRLHKELHGENGPLTLNLDLKVAAGEFLLLTGPSGGGKTSTLRMLAGLLPPDRGHLRFAAQNWYDSTDKTFLPPQRRNVGFVFQDYALFPHLTVAGNLRFAAGHGREKRLAELLEATGLSHLADQRPATLSGGQQQRVALARALAQEPDLLLLDEPLAALDREKSRELRGYLRDAHRRYGLTTIMVSHDPADAAELADRVLELRDGRLHERAVGSKTATVVSVDGGLTVTIPVSAAELARFRKGDQFTITLPE